MMIFVGVIVGFVAISVIIPMYSLLTNQINVHPMIICLEKYPGMKRAPLWLEELMTVAIIGFGIVILVAMITTGVVGVRRWR